MHKVLGKWYGQIIAGKDKDALRILYNAAVEKFAKDAAEWNTKFTAALGQYVRDIYLSNEYVCREVKECQNGPHTKIKRENLMLMCKEWNRVVDTKEKEIEEILKKYTYECVIISAMTEDRAELVEELSEGLEDLFNSRVEKNYSTYSVEQMETLLNKLDFLGKQIVEFEPWDYNYNINLFAESLIETGKYMRKYGHCVNSEKEGRRCMSAGGMLKKAYAGRTDRAVKNLSNKVEMKVVKTDSFLSTMDRVFHSKNPEMTNKMLTYAFKRSERQESKDQFDAWERITKKVGKEGWECPRINLWWD